MVELHRPRTADQEKYADEARKLNMDPAEVILQGKFHQANMETQASADEAHDRITRLSEQVSSRLADIEGKLQKDMSDSRKLEWTKHQVKILMFQLESLSVDLSDFVSVRSLSQKTNDTLMDWKPGKHTTVGGAASEDITLKGVTAAMRCQVSMEVEGAIARNLLSAKCGVDKITVTFSGDPSTDHVLNYLVY